jgi:ribose transport system permease protein
VGEVTEKAPVRRILEALANDKVSIAFLMVAALFVVGEIVVPGFITFAHVMTVLQAAFFLGLMSLGQTIVVISGKEGLDLSVGSSMTVGVLLGAALIRGQDLNLIQAVAAVLVAGFLVGLVNGLGVAYLEIAPLIMTLAWGIVLEGAMLFITRGRYPGKASPLLERIGQGSLSIELGPVLLQIPWVVVIWILIIAVVQIVLARTSVGYVLYGVGANDRAAELLGIRTRRVRVIAYGVSGMLSALSGILLLGYVQNPDIALSSRYVLLCVIAVIIGGISFGGGNGSYLGAVAGAIFLQTLLSILVTLQIKDGLRQMITGLVLLVLLFAYTRRARR